MALGPSIKAIDTGAMGEGVGLRLNELSQVLKKFEQGLVRRLKAVAWQLEHRSVWNSTVETNSREI